MLWPICCLAAVPSIANSSKAVASYNIAKDKQSHSVFFFWPYSFSLLNMNVVVTIAVFVSAVFAADAMIYQHRLPSEG